MSLLVLVMVSVVLTFSHLLLVSILFLGKTTDCMLSKMNNFVSTGSLAKPQKPFKKYSSSFTSEPDS